MVPGRADMLVRVWLPACNVVVLALIAVGSLGFLVREEMAGGIQALPPVRQAHVARSQPPLPRQRPEEPAFTGSLGRKPEPGRARIEGDEELGARIVTRMGTTP